ncbi:hypothetical protein [Bacteroides sp.]|nr:hypothetical protein [Bacteroides sp.]
MTRPLGAASIAIGSQCKNDVKQLRYMTFNPEPYVNNDALVFWMIDVATR